MFPRKKTILDIVFNHNFTQVVKDCTRIADQSQSLLDLVFITDNVAEYKVSFIEGISDHKIVLFTTPLSQHGHCQASTPIVVKDLARADDTSILDYLETSLKTSE